MTDLSRGGRRSLFAALVIVSISIVALGADKGQSDTAGGILSKLRSDQPVILIEKNDRYEIRPVADALERSHTIVEIGHDYVLLRDLTEQIETVVPVYSIKCVTIVKDL